MKITMMMNNLENKFIKIECKNGMIEGSSFLHFLVAKMLTLTSKKKSYKIENNTYIYEIEHFIDGDMNKMYNEIDHFINILQKKPLSNYILIENTLASETKLSVKQINHIVDKIRVSEYSNDTDTKF